MVRLASGRRSASCGQPHCEQRCWVHKTANVLNKLPKSQQPKANRSLQEIWMGRDEQGRRGRVRRLHSQPTAEIRKGRRVPGKGSPGPARILRFPCRTLETPADLKPDREHLCHRGAPHYPLVVLPLE